MSVQPRGRTTAVPHRLSVPRPAASILLQIAEHRLIEAARIARPSDRASIERLIWTDRDAAALARQGYGGLFDELSPHVRAREATDPARLTAKSLMELGAVEHVERHGVAGALIDAEAFLDLLRRVHRAVKGGGTSFRRGDAFIRPDDDGNLIVFPPWQLCEPLLRSLAGFIAAHCDRYPALCAVIAYAGIIHAHPFRDANGRTARVCFNLLLRHASGTNHFVPLSKLSALSDGGFLIKLRRALYGGEWEPLAAFYADAVRLSDELQNENGSRESLSLGGERK